MSLVPGLCTSSRSAATIARIPAATRWTSADGPPRLRRRRARRQVAAAATRTHARGVRAPHLALARRPGPWSRRWAKCLAAPASSAVDLPLFTQSAADGYALRAADSAAPLKLVGEIAAGDAAKQPVVSGEACAFSPAAQCPGRKHHRAPGDRRARGRDDPPGAAAGGGADTRYRSEAPSPAAASACTRAFSPRWLIRPQCNQWIASRYALRAQRSAAALHQGGYL